jgi:hypothetical protein
MRIASLVLLLLVGLPIRVGAQGVTARLENSLTKVQDALGETFARALPLPSASAGVSYAFDPATGNFQRESSTFGQVYLDRADTLGARRVNLSFAYQYVQLEELDGKSADDLRDPTPIYLPGRAGAIDSRTCASRQRASFLFAGTAACRAISGGIAVPIHTATSSRTPTCASRAYALPISRVHAARRGRRYDAGGGVALSSCGGIVWSYRPDPRRGPACCPPASGSGRTFRSASSR